MRKTGLTLAGLGALALLTANCSTSSKPKNGTATLTLAPTATATCGGIGNLCNVAGAAGFAAFGGDGGPSTQSYLYWPQDTYVDTTGNVYIMDWNNQRIRKIDSSGTINTICGAGILGNDCNTQALSTQLNHCPQMVIQGSYIYFAGWHDHDAKRMDLSTGLVTCPVGTGAAGCAGIPGPATSAVTGFLNSLDFDTAGNMYVFVQSCQRVCMVDTAGNMSFVAGAGTRGCIDSPNPTTAQFSMSVGSNAAPGGRIAIDTLWNVLYVADGDITNAATSCNKVRQVDLTTGAVTTLAGTGTAGYSGDNAAATLATLNSPMDVAVGPDHSVYIADTKNHAVRRVDPSGIITTVAGTGVQGVSANGTVATSAMLNMPCGVFVTSNSYLYVADTFNQQVKKVRLQ